MLLNRMGGTLDRFAQRFVPDPFILAIGLNVVVFFLAATLMLGSGTSGATDTVKTLSTSWLAAFSNSALLGFALQMCFVLVTGHALAMSPPVQRGIRWLAGVPKSAGGATVIVAMVACVAAVIHWGLGAIVGALLAREIGKHAADRDLPVHYPLLGAAAYVGMAVWHGGLSGSAPLKVSEGDSLAPGLSLGDLLLSPLNLAVIGSLIFLIPLLLFLLTPKSAEEMRPPPNAIRLPTAESRGTKRNNDSRWPGFVVGCVGLSAMVLMIAFGDAKLDINSVNLLFFFTGIAMVGNLARYAEHVADGARGAGAIIIQFPLYFGVLGLMKGSGMVAWISNGMAQAGGATTTPLLTYASAGAVNLAVPSGGGQWAVQREILLTSSAELGLDPTTTILAFSYGDAWTNMLQPFWALPLLGIMGLKAKDIIGYTAMVFLMMAVVVPFWLVVLG